jgi:hypothetical protein
MIKSKLVLNIIDLLLETDEHESSLRKQLNFLQESQVEYTGAGAFISFESSEGIEDFRIPKNSAIINGVKIESSELNIGGEACLFISEGIIDYLEIRSYDGSYPKHEPIDYVLTQIWENSPRRKIAST